MKCFPVLILIAMSLAHAAAFGSGATSPPGQSNPDSETFALRNAVNALSAEYQAVLQDPEKSVRVECDYFKTNPALAVTPGGVLGVLERGGRGSVHGDARVECYVKWQLLSAVRGKFDESLAARALAIYRQTPTLAPRPGISPREQHELALHAQGKGQADEEGIEHELLERVAQFNAYNSPILKFRDELYAKLPVGSEALSLGCQDAASRLQAGISEMSIDPLLEQIDRDYRTLTASLGDETQKRALAGQIARLANVKGATYYQTITWSDKVNRLVWKSHTVDLRGREPFESLVKASRDALDAGSSPATRERN